MVKGTVSSKVSRCKSLLLRQCPYSPVLPVMGRPHAAPHEVALIPPENEPVLALFETDALPPVETDALPVVPEVDPLPLPSEP